MADPRPLNVGLIGYGMSTRVLHIPFIINCPGAKVHAVVQRAEAPENPESIPSSPRLRPASYMPHVTVEHPSAKHYQDAKDLFADDEVDLVVVATPSQGHYAFVKDALEAGKHVLVEKPMCPTAKECDELIALAKEKGKILTVFQNRRLDSDFQTLVSILTKQPTKSALTPLIELESCYDRYRPYAPSKGWKSENVPGTGILYDLGSHLIDQVLYLLGTPKWISAHLFNQRRQEPLDVEDSFTILMEWQDRDKDNQWNSGKDLQVELKSSMLSVADRQLRFYIRGWKGSWTKLHLDVQEEQLKTHLSNAPTLPGYGSEMPSDWGTLNTAEPLTHPRRRRRTDADPDDDDDEPEVKEKKEVEIPPAPATGEGMDDRFPVEGEYQESKAGFFISTTPSVKGNYVLFWKNLVKVWTSVEHEGKSAEEAMKELMVKPEESRDAVRIIELAKESSKKGCRIDINEEVMGSPLRMGIYRA